MHERTLICLAATPVCIGVAGLLGGHFGFAPALVGTLHVMFGLAAFAAIALALVAGARHLEHRPVAELHHYTRLVSRSVYIGLYGLAAARVGLHLVEASQAHGMHPWAVRPMDDLQLYIAACIIPLWVVRAWVLSPASAGA